MELRSQTLTLTTARPFVISAGTTTRKDIVIVELHHEDIVGYGEAAPSKRVTGEDASTVEAFLRWVRTVIPQDADALPEFLAHLHEDICGNGAARAAVDLAVHDLRGKRQRLSARERLGLAAGSVATSATVSMDTPAAMAEEAKDWAARGYHALKLKLGAAAMDLARVRAVRDAVPAARLFVDANQSWTVEEACRLAPALADCDVEILEQPVLATDLEGLARVAERSPIPVIADESVLDRHDVARLVAAGFRGGVNVKLQKAGGLTPAVEALRAARKQGFRTMVGCNLETSVGISAALQTLSLVEWGDLDGNVLLARDPFVTTPRGGILASPPGVGLGVHPTRYYTPARPTKPGPARPPSMDFGDAGTEPGLRP
ncbi:MAG: dipeptide epimerase [Thermoplasmatota archaeon]